MEFKRIRQPAELCYTLHHIWPMAFRRRLVLVEVPPMRGGRDIGRCLRDGAAMELYCVYIGPEVFPSMLWSDYRLQSAYIAFLFSSVSDIL